MEALVAGAVAEMTGAVVSMIIALFAQMEFTAPGLGRVRVALFPAASMMEVPAVRAVVVA